MYECMFINSTPYTSCIHDLIEMLTRHHNDVKTFDKGTAVRRKMVLLETPCIPLFVAALVPVLYFTSYNCGL